MNSIVVMVVLIIALLFSIIINMFLLWYSWKSLQQLTYYEEELREVVGAIQNFTNHLGIVYEMEMFYGDETLRHLLEHAKDLIQVFSQYNTELEDGDLDELEMTDEQQ